MQFYMHLGTSTIHYALYDERECKYFNHIFINNWNERVIIDFAKKHASEIDGFYVSSVNLLFNSFVSEISDICGVEVHKIHIKDLMTTLDLSLVDANNIGIDIVVALWYASREYRNIILLDFGQITKIYKVVDRQVRGGALLPSTSLQIRSIIQNIDRINNFEDALVDEQELGRNASEALTVGVVHGHALIVNHLVNQYLADGKNYKIIVIGGFFETEKPRLAFKAPYEYRFGYILDAMNQFITNQ